MCGIRIPKMSQQCQVVMNVSFVRQLTRCGSDGSSVATLRYVASLSVLFGFHLLVCMPSFQSCWCYSIPV